MNPNLFMNLFENWSHNIPQEVILWQGELKKERLNQLLDERNIKGDERYREAAKVIASEVAKYRSGGAFADEFPDRWVPAVIALANELFWRMLISS